MATSSNKHKMKCYLLIFTNRVSLLEMKYNMTTIATFISMPVTRIAMVATLKTLSKQRMADKYLGKMVCNN